MIPPALIAKAVQLVGPLAAKLTSPLAKWGIVAVIVLGTNAYTWHWTTVKCEKGKAEAIAEQARIYTQQAAQLTESRESILRQLNDVRRESDQQILTIQKRLVIYEQKLKRKEMPTATESRLMFDSISSLFPTQNIVPSPNATTGKPDEPSEATIATTRLLLAYTGAYADCAGELKILWDDYDSLVRILRAQYSIQTGEQ